MSGFILLDPSLVTQPRLLKLDTAFELVRDPTVKAAS
jgi:hypothetical protein